MPEMHFIVRDILTSLYRLLDITLALSTNLVASPGLKKMASSKLYATSPSG